MDTKMSNYSTNRSYRALVSDTITHKMTIITTSKGLLALDISNLVGKMTSIRGLWALPSSHVTQKITNNGDKTTSIGLLGLYY